MKTLIIKWRDYIMYYVAFIMFLCGFLIAMGIVMLVDNYRTTKHVKEVIANEKFNRMMRDINLKSGI